MKQRIKGIFSSVVVALLSSFATAAFMPRIWATYSPSSTMTPWASSTVTGDWSTNTTYTAQSRRVGDTQETVLRVDLSGAPDTANLEVNPPDGVTVDEAKLLTSGNRPVVGYGMVVDNGTANRGNVVCTWDYTANQVFIYVCTTQPNTVTQITQAVPQTFATGDSVLVRFTLPVTGW